LAQQQRAHGDEAVTKAASARTADSKPSLPTEKYAGQYDTFKAKWRDRSLAADA
jgi:hypothetical protein